MRSIGFIGDEQDIKQRFKMLEKIYGKKSVSILKTEITERKPNEFQTVEELVQNTDLLFIGNNALANRPLLYHAIKKSDRLFLDIQSPLPKTTFVKCKAYQEEAGCIVSFNINPYLIFKSTLPIDSGKTAHALIRSYSVDSEVKSEVYKYLLFGYFFLDCSNIRSQFNSIIQADGSIRLVNVTLTNLKGKQVNIIVGNYAQKTNRIQVFDDESLIDVDLPRKKFFNDQEVLKQQLDSLYNNQQLADLNHGAVVAELINKMEEKTNQ